MCTIVRAFASPVKQLSTRAALAGIARLAQLAERNSQIRGKCFLVDHPHPGELLVAEPPNRRDNKTSHLTVDPVGNECRQESPVVMAETYVVPHVDTSGSASLKTSRQANDDHNVHAQVLARRQRRHGGSMS
ncbi:MAG TPA: hypothetical protein VF506_00785 [Streptosporangiaceae bacterium]